MPAMMAVSQHADRASKSIPVPTWTRPQTGQSIPVRLTIDQWIMGQMGQQMWMGNVDHGSVSVTHRPTSESIKCEQPYQRFINYFICSTVVKKIVYKKLSCRRETARRFMSSNILLSHSKSLKVIRNDTVE